MEIEEIRRRKAELEHDIADRILAFELDTDVAVTGIHYESKKRNWTIGDGLLPSALVRIEAWL